MEKKVYSSLFTNGVFDATKITKYYKNQSPAIKQKHFTDDLFPPTENSLIGKDSKGDWVDPINGPNRASAIRTTHVQWKRIPEIMEKYLLFENKIEVDDIKQGNLGNCYFLAAIAALSEFPFLIFQLFKTRSANPEGLYEIALFIEGEWQIVIVDDYFPFDVNLNSFVFAKPQGNELWVILLEKAWAKVNGGYSLTIAGWPSDPLSALTGFATEKIVHKDTPPDEIWKRIFVSDKNNSIMCTSTKADPSIEKMGLIENHSYTLVSADSTLYNGKQLRLIRIRNPWGYREWCGDWSDNSPLWTPELRKIYNEVQAEDGTFYMSLDDFIKFFDSTHICNVLYDSCVKSFAISNEDIQFPHVFNIYFEKDNRTSISLLLPHWRYNRSIINKHHPATMVFGRYDESNNIVDVEGQYSTLDSIEVLRNFKKGYYVVCFFIAKSLSEIELNDVFFRVSSTDSFKIIDNGVDPSFLVLKKILLEGIKQKEREKYDSSETTFTSIENQFKKSGIGYRAIYNKDKTHYQKWEFNAEKLENVYLLPPFTDKEKFVLYVPPKSERIVIGIKSKISGNYWFNLESRTLAGTGKLPKEANEEKAITEAFLQLYLQEDFAFNTEDNDYYDYHSSSLEKSKLSLKFEHLDVSDSVLEKLKSEHNELITELLKFEEIDKELIWNKAKYDNGYYIGEFNNLNSRHGRGVYVWNEGTVFIGYWEHGLKSIFGKFLSKNKTVIFEGELKKGLKNGKGMQIFNDGSKYEGMFLNDKKHGDGIFYWDDGSYWKGKFVNGQLHGMGLFKSLEDDEEYEVEYENGQMVENSE